MNSPRSPALLSRTFFVLFNTVTSDFISYRVFLSYLYSLFFPLRFEAYCLKSSLFMYLPPFVLAYSASLSDNVFSRAYFSTSSFLISPCFCSFFLVSILAYCLKIPNLSSAGVDSLIFYSRVIHSFWSLFVSFVNLSSSLWVVIGSWRRISILYRRSLLSFSSRPRTSLLISRFFLTSVLSNSSILSGPKF
jgi:hypothetical protein